MGVLKTTAYEDLSLPLTIVDDFTIALRYQSQEALRRLTQACSRPQLNPETRQMEERIDDKLWNAKAPLLYIDPTKSSGCTIAALRKGLKTERAQLDHLPLAEQQPTKFFTPRT